jgi:hypothetical protein
VWLQSCRPCGSNLARPGVNLCTTTMLPRELEGRRVRRPGSHGQHPAPEPLPAFHERELRTHAKCRARAPRVRPHLIGALRSVPPPWRNTPRPPGCLALTRPEMGQATDPRSCPAWRISIRLGERGGGVRPS